MKQFKSVEELSKSEFKKAIKMRKKLNDIEDKVSKICIGYGEGRIPKEQFDSACKQLNVASIKILSKNGLL